MAPRTSRRNAAAEALAPVHEMESNKENVVEGALALPKSPPPAKKGLKNTRNWEEELDAMTQKLNTMKLEKEEFEKRVLEQDLQLKEQQERIIVQSKEQQKLQEKLKKLQKDKEVQELLNAPAPDECSDDSKGKKKRSQAKEKPKKMEKDPEKPKRPVSGFMVYSNERRPALMAENMKVTQIAKKLGEEWRGMDENARAPYEKTAAEKKSAYLVEMEAYNNKKAEEEVEAVPEKATKSKARPLKMKEKATKATRAPTSKVKVVEPGMPKKSNSAYILFSMEYRKQLQAEVPATSPKQMTVLIGSKWKEMSDEEKQPFVDQAAVEKQKYEEAVAEFKAGANARAEQEENDASSSS